MSIFSSARMAASGLGPQQSFAFGELTAYNPANHTGQFALPAHPDPLTGEPTITGFIQIGTPHVGDNGSGAQFPPKIGAQAIIMFIDTRQEFPIFSQWYFNSVENPPFQDGKSWGWTDPQGSSVATTKDGKTPGDGVGAVKSIAKGYHLAGTLGTEFNAALQTVHDNLTQEIAHLAPSINLGALKSAMSASNAALNNAHLGDFENLLHTQRLTDLENLATAVSGGLAVASPPVTLAPATIIALIASLAHINISGIGSSVTNLVT